MHRVTAPLPLSEVMKYNRVFAARKQCPPRRLIARNFHLVIKIAYAACRRHGSRTHRECRENQETRCRYLRNTASGEMLPAISRSRPQWAVNLITASIGVAVYAGKRQET